MYGPETFFNRRYTLFSSLLEHRTASVGPPCSCVASWMQVLSAAGRNWHVTPVLGQAVRCAQPGTAPSVVCACQGDERTASPRPEPMVPIVQYQPKARKAAAVPQNVPVVHSSAYLLRRSKLKDTPRPAVQSSGDESVDHVEQNAVEWALRQADAYFDRVEADTDKLSPARVLVKNPATQATMKTMQGVTSLGAATAPELAKVAMPVGKKLLSVSADVLVAGVGALSSAAKANKARKKSEQQKVPER